MKPNDSIVSSHIVNATSQSILNTSKTALFDHPSEIVSPSSYGEKKFTLFTHSSIINTLLDKIIVKNDIIPYVWYWYSLILVAFAGLTLGGASVVTPVIVSESIENLDQLLYLGVLFCMKRM
jgi:hypothetical protein